MTDVLKGENPVILAYMHQLGMAENERVYGALAVGYPDTEDGLPVRTALPRTGNPVTVVEGALCSGK